MRKTQAPAFPVSQTLLIEREGRQSAVLNFEAPLPERSKAWRWLHEQLERESREGGFSYEARPAKDTQGAAVEGTIASIAVRDAPKGTIDDLIWMEKEASQEWLKNRAMMPEPPMDNLLRKAKPATYRDMLNMCDKCSNFLNTAGGNVPPVLSAVLNRLGNHSTRVGYGIGGCVSVSKLPGKDEDRNPEFVEDYLYGKKLTQTEAMRRGTIAHEVLELRRNPALDPDEFVGRLADGTSSWVPWVLPVCSPKDGLRAITPDVVISRLERGEKGYHLTHVIIEDKQSGNPEYLKQVYGEGMILRYSSWLLHYNQKKDEFHKTPGVPFNSMLAQKLGLAGPEDLAVDVYVAINVYKDPMHPVDNYSYIGKGGAPQGVEPPLHWSKDGITLPENFGREEWVKRAKRSRNDALLMALTDEIKKMGMPEMEVFMLEREKKDGNEDGFKSPTLLGALRMAKNREGAAGQQ